MFIKDKKKNKEKGFTLVEALIAIAILMISVAAPLSLAAKGIQAANLAKQQIVAFYLAQDAYEFIKNKTDTNKINNEVYAAGGIIKGLDVCVSDICDVDTIQGGVRRYIPGTKIKYFTDTNVYGFNNSANGSVPVDSIYSRYIKIKKIKDTGNSIDEIKVTVTVEWKKIYGGTQKYVLEGHITNW